MNNFEPHPLLSVTATIFEELGFLAPTVAVNDTQRAAGLDCTASVDFDGHGSGRLVVRLYGGVLPALAANMLGEWDAPGPELQRDALGEFANVLCGNLLRSIHGTRALFRLAPPCVPAATQLHAALESHRVMLGLEAGRAEVELFAVVGAGAGAVS